MAARLLRGLDIFCGVGGSSTGARSSGIKIVAAVDMCPIATATYQDNFHGTKVLTSRLENLGLTELRRIVGRIDLLIASPECTNHTCAKGAAPRSEVSRKTAFEVIRFARQLKARWLVVENVPHMRSWRRYPAWIEALKALGYHVREQVLNAADFGVPQSRRRLFVLCDRESEPSEVRPTVIDGTVSRLRTLSGLRCQIGIVAVNYFNEKIRKSYFISETSLQEEIDDVIEVLKRRESKNRVVSDMVVRALMLYREREVAIRGEFKQGFKLLHGPLLPWELMTGLGRLRALEATLEILQSLISDKRCFSIVSSSTQEDYLTLGSALQPGEYLVDEKFTCGDEIGGNEDFMAERKWRPDELDRMKQFLREYASNIWVGVIKVSDHPYVFHAHREHFDLAAAIIARDSLLQKEKGFPLLIDYADTLCSGYFPPSDFTNILTYRLARSGDFLAETPEQSMRLK